MYLACGKRPGEKALLMCFCSPLQESLLHAMLRENFHIQEIDSDEELCSSIQDLVFNYQNVAGDTEECVRKTDAMFERALERWSGCMDRAEGSACQRAEGRMRGACKST